MGCTGSKNGTEGRARRRMPRFLQPMTPNSADQRLAIALRALKKHMDEEHSAVEAFSFTKIILKLGTIERVLRRIKAVFLSVDHGNKGHVTKEELKEGLHKAKVELGEEWEDTNIDECLEHLGTGGADHDHVGLREFVVMLAVGRVCRPLKLVPAVLVSPRAAEDPPLLQRRDTRPTMGTIKEDEARRPSLTPKAGAAKHDVCTDQESVTASQQPADVASSDTATDVAVAIAPAAPTHDADDNPTASAGPGGLPRGNSWRNLKWARIPSIRSLSLTRNVSATGNDDVNNGDVDVSRSVKYVLDLFIAAYFQFDTTGQGFMTKSVVEKNLRQAEREDGIGPLLDEKRLAELAWDGDRLSFQEFIYAFAQWLGLDDDDSVSLSHSSRHDVGVTPAVSSTIAATAPSSQRDSGGTSTSAAVVVS